MNPAVRPRRALATRARARASHDSTRSLTRATRYALRSLLCSYQEAYSTRILALREKELAAIRLAALIGLWNSMLWLGGPILISMAAFFTYTWMGYELEASVAFPALALFNLLRFPVMMLPTQLENIINANVAMKRIQAFMEKGEMKALTTASDRRLGSLRIRGSFGWGDGQDLLSLDTKIDAGSLTMVIGEVGSGKSSLLQAVLGEMRARGRHEIDVNGTVAYTQQDPWIQNMSLRDNILMGSAYDAIRYQRVVRACALEPDLGILPAGDMTEIGEKGVNLSGGQRHRVALARACYQEADIYLLDDPLSAVDAEVGRLLMDQCITGLLAGKTIVLVTHQLQYLPQSSAVMILAGGKVSDFDTYANLVAKGIDFHQYEGDGDDDGVGGGGGGGGDDNHNVVVADAAAPDVDVDVDVDATAETSGTTASTSAGTSTSTSTSTGTDDDDTTADSKVLLSALDEQKKNITKAEERAVGRVSRHVYAKYFSVWGTKWLPGIVLPIIVLSLAFMEKGLQSGQSWWLSVWSAGVESAASSEEQEEAWWVLIAVRSLSLTLSLTLRALLVRSFARSPGTI